VKKLILIVSFVLLLSGCVSYSIGQKASSAPAPKVSQITADEITSFQLNEKTGDNATEFKVNCVDFTASLSEAGTVKSEVWDNSKWDSFISDLLAMGILDTETQDYEPGGPAEWSIALTGDFGIKVMSGAGSCPPKWNEFKDMLSGYFGN
jgi:hypothetical protein